MVTFLLSQVSEYSNIDFDVLSAVCCQIWDDDVQVLNHLDLLVIHQYMAYLELAPYNLYKLIDDCAYYLNKHDQQTYARLKMMTTIEIANTIKMQGSEFGLVHKFFKANHAQVIPGSQLIPVVARKLKRPDFVVALDGKEYPVECKLKVITPSIKQLEGYMRLWQVDKGFMVAPKFSVKTPSNIVQIHVS